ncbi:unnamed protein product, partial [Choristocarpus tenellus]
MVRGLPTVTTSAGIKGLGIPSDKLEDTILVRDDPEAFANAVISVSRDRALWEKLS